MEVEFKRELLPRYTYIFRLFIMQSVILIEHPKLPKGQMMNPPSYLGT
jgi:hypothetical protein